MPAKKKISEKTDKRYRAKITIPDSGGQSIWIAAKTKAELERKKEQVRRELIDGVQMHDIPFVELVVEWFQRVKEPKIKTVATAKTWKNAINNHIIPHFDPRKMTRAIRPQDLQECIDATAGYSSTIITVVSAALRHVCRYAISQRYITIDPSIELTRPESPKAKPKYAFTREQSDNILRVARTHEFGMIWMLLYYLGLRRGEMLGLQWGDINWETNMISIERDIDYAHSHRAEIGTLKTENAKREVPMPEELAEYLRPLRQLPGAFLVHESNGLPLNYGTFRYRWGRLMIDAGYARLSERYDEREKHRKERGVKTHAPSPVMDYDYDFTAHFFRHNYITACVIAGLPAEVTMQIVGHADYKTTINIYAHIQSLINQKTGNEIAEAIRTANIL